MRVIEEHRNRVEKKALAKELSFRSSLTHSELPVSPATREDGKQPNINRYGFFPPMAKSIEGFVLSYMPYAVNYHWHNRGFDLKVVTMSAMSRVLRQDIDFCVSMQNVILNVNGFFAPSQACIFLREDIQQTKPDRDCQYWQNVEDIGGHEMGHFIDWCWGYPSLENEFLSVYRKERARLDTYSASRSYEFFATACWICCRYPSNARRHIPTTYAWFNQFLKEIC